jgi:hypothetical protein
VMWWSSPVNFILRSRFAASRTRSSALGALSRLCVRRAFCPIRFPLVAPLPSTPSAPAFAALFRSFVGTTGTCDFSWSFISGFRPQPSPCGWLSVRSGQQPRDLSVLAHGVVRVHALVLRPRQSVRLSRFRSVRCCLPPEAMASASGSAVFAAHLRGLHTPC